MKNMKAELYFIKEKLKSRMIYHIVNNQFCLPRAQSSWYFKYLSPSWEWMLSTHQLEWSVDAFVVHLMRYISKCKCCAYHMIDEPFHLLIAHTSWYSKTYLQVETEWYPLTNLSKVLKALWSTWQGTSHKAWDI